MHDIDESVFFQNVEKQNAVLRRLEIIGEAVKKLPEEVRQLNNKVPWRQIAGMRDVITREIRIYPKNPYLYGLITITPFYSHEHKRARSGSHERRR